MSTKHLWINENIFYEITNKKIINSFGKKLFDAINLLTVDRKQQWKRIYKKKYYDKINNSNEIIILKQYLSIKRLRTLFQLSIFFTFIIKVI